jgi:hypothetical protein
VDQCIVLALSKDWGLQVGCCTFPSWTKDLFQ